MCVRVQVEYYASGKFSRHGPCRKGRSTYTTKKNNEPMRKDKKIKPYVHIYIYIIENKLSEVVFPNLLASGRRI